MALWSSWFAKISVFCSTSEVSFTAADVENGAENLENGSSAFPVLPVTEEWADESPNISMEWTGNSTVAPNDNGSVTLTGDSSVTDMTMTTSAKFYRDENRRPGNIRPAGKPKPFVTKPNNYPKPTLATANTDVPEFTTQNHFRHTRSPTPTSNKKPLTVQSNGYTTSALEPEMTTVKTKIPDRGPVNRPWTKPPVKRDAPSDFNRNVNDFAASIVERAQSMFDFGTSFFEKISQKFSSLLERLLNGGMCMYVVNLLCMHFFS